MGKIQLIIKNADGADECVDDLALIAGIIDVAILETGNPIHGLGPGAAWGCFSEVWNPADQPLILLPDETLLSASLPLNDLELKETGPYAGAVLYSVPVLLIYTAAWAILGKKRFQDEPLFSQ